MKIENIYLYRLRNDTHFQFMQYVVALVKEIGAEALRVEAQMAALTLLHSQEDEALKKIVRSALTDDIEDADHARDAVFRGLSDAVVSATNHYNPIVGEAARRLRIVFDTYGNVVARTLDDETSAIHNLLVELTTKGALDAETLDLGGWIGELDRLNLEVQGLILRRADEEAERTKLVLRTVRLEVDEAYRILVERVDALAVVDGGAVYDTFISRLNEIVVRTRDIAAQQAGRREKKKL
ncbi:MAG: DUF6261 family protein [Alistipes sp.]|jgi:hypothetical protein|nr:DUF6261 family protein [Alistipes sp.]